MTCGVAVTPFAGGVGPISVRGVGGILRRTQRRGWAGGTSREGASTSMGFEAPGLGDASRFELQSRQSEAAIGAPLEAVRASLLGLVGRLGGLLNEHAAPLLEAAGRQLEERTCRIAVIGQIKAGKSTFVNALTRRPGLLPTDINPWTVVVTALHFRNGPTPPEHAAVFHLFSADEWRDLADGGGRLRELTERLVPGFLPDLLRAQLEVMRKRTEQRLGPKLAELLGQCHRFQAVTPQLLTDYVSAGDEDAWPGKRRHYSDITRSADLYFNDGPFAFPITLIDTPGTNDPFLVRDEITRRSVENPDIYVFVVSATQPLSTADIGMLRLLNGLNKDRIVVFINRADQLPNLNDDAKAVKAAIEKRLRAELPSLDIPVVYGSAWLGNLRLQAEAGGIPVMSPQPPAGAPKAAARAPACALELGPAPDPLPALSRAVQTATHAAAGASPCAAAAARQELARAARAVHMSSGLAEVSAAITRLMCTSGVAMLMRQIAMCLAELVRSAEVTDRTELEAIEALITTRREEEAALARRVAEEERSLAAFEEHAGALQASFEEVEAHFRGVVATAGRVLRDRLCGLVRDFAASEADALLRGTGGEAAPVDVALRRGAPASAAAGCLHRHLRAGRRRHRPHRAGPLPAAEADRLLPAPELPRRSPGGGGVARWVRPLDGAARRQGHHGPRRVLVGALVRHAQGGQGARHSSALPDRGGLPQDF